MRARMRPGGIALIALGIVLLAIGFAASNDFLGFLFMVCLVVGLVILVADLVLRRRAA